MKRIILFSLMIISLVCMLAFAVNAQGSKSNEYGEITVIEGAGEPTVIDSTSKVVLLASDGTYYTFPSYYIVEDKATFRWKKNEAVSAILGYTSSAANNDFRPYVIRMEIPTGITSINPGSEGGAYAFEDAKKIVEATIPATLTVMGNYTFNRAYLLETINGFEEFMQRATKLGNMMLAETAWGADFDLVIPSTVTAVPERCFYGTKIKSVTFPDNLTQIGSRAFQGCLNLTSVTIPGTVEYMKNHAFAACSNLNSVDMSKCTSLKEIGEYAFEKTKLTEFNFTPFKDTLVTVGDGIFNQCGSLSTVTGYDKVDGITAVGANMFSGCPLTELLFPKNITSIGSYAYFNHKSTQTEVRIPNGVKSIGDHAFARNNGTPNVSGVKIYLSASLTTISGVYNFEYWDYAEMYIPASLTSIPKGFCNGTNQTGTVYYYTGAKNGFSIHETHNTALLNAEWISVNDFTGASNDKNYIVYGYDICEAFYRGVHYLDPNKSNDCAGECINCKNQALASEPKHSFEQSIVYTNYLAKGKKIQICQNTGCAYSNGYVDAPVDEDNNKIYGIVTDVNPLVREFKGFSINRSGDAITFGYEFDYDAISEFEELYNTKLEFGFVVAVKAFLGEKSPLDNNGAPSESSVIKASVTRNEVGYTGVDCILYGDWSGEAIVNGETVDVKLVEFYMAGYMLFDGAVVYLNYKESSDTAASISYSQLS